MSSKKEPIAILHTAFIGDLVLLGLLIEVLYLNGFSPILITNKSGYHVYENDPRVKNIIVIKKGRGFKKIKNFIINAFLINNLKIKTFINAHRSLNSALLCGLSGADLKIGFEGSFDFIRNLIFNFKLPYRLETHERLRLLSLIKPLFPHISLQDFANYPLPTLKGPKSLQGYPYDMLNGKKFIIVSPGSVWATKVYPPRKLSLVVEIFLKHRNDVVVLVSGGPGDKSYIDEFLSSENLLPFKNNIINGFGVLPLSGLIYLAPKSLGFLTNDSAPLHIASALAVPTVAIFGPTPTDTGFAPYSPKSVILDHKACFGAPLSCQPCSSHGGPRCPLGHHKCMTEIDPNIIASILIELST